MEKDFIKWSDLKQKINKRENLPTFKQREVWWCSLGVNIGHEEDGKNELFNRPVLVIKKFNNNLLLALPLSSKFKDNKFYHPVHLGGREGSVLLSQIRALESRRLTHKLGTITKEQFESVRKKVKEMI